MGLIGILFKDNKQRDETYKVLNSTFPQFYVTAPIDFPVPGTDRESYIQAILDEEASMGNVISLNPLTEALYDLDKQSALFKDHNGETRGRYDAIISAYSHPVNWMGYFGRRSNPIRSIREGEDLVGLLKEKTKDWKYLTPV